MKRGQRLISALLSLCLLFSLLPAMPAAAAEEGKIEETHPESYLSIEDLQTKDPDYAGMVYQLEKEGDYYRIDFQLYNLAPLDVLNCRLGYDSNAVEIVQWANKASFEKVNANPFGTNYQPQNTSALVGYPNFPLDAIKAEHREDSNIKDTITGKSITDKYTGIFTAANDDVVVLGLDSTSGDDTGDIAFRLFAITSDPNAYPFGDYLSIFDKGVSQASTPLVLVKTDTLRTAEEKAIPFTVAQMYFKVIDETLIDEDTFFLRTKYAANNIDPINNYVGNSTLGAESQFNKDVVFVGFPQPTHHKVAVRVYPTQALADAGGEAGPWLKTTGASVMIDTTTYGLTEDGHLADHSTGEPITELDLEHEEHSFTVSPGSEDTDSYILRQGTFNVEPDTPLVKLCAKAPDEVDPKLYKIKLLDGSSAGKSKTLAAGKEVEVTLGGGQPETKHVAADGTINVLIRPDSPTNLKLKVDGYQPVDIRATFKEDGTVIMDGGASREAAPVLAKLELTIEPPVTKIALPDSLPAGSYVLVEKNPTGSVNEYMSGDETTPGALPMTITVNGGATGTNLTLPNGDYIYTIVSPGKEDVRKTLSVADNQITINGTVTAGTEEPVDGVSQVVMPADGAAGEDISDRLYSGVGTWDAAQKVMTFTVSVKNMEDVMSGTFGIRYDDDVFTLSNAAINTERVILPDLPVQTGSGPIAVDNPVKQANVENLTYGYHVFHWQLKGGTSIFDKPAELTDGTELVTYTLTLNTDKTMADVGDRSITVMPYEYTSNGTAIIGQLGSVSAAEQYLERYWRGVDAENGKAELDSHRLAEDKALEDGFYQVYTDGSASTRELDLGAQTLGTDARTQLVYTHSGKVGVKFVSEIKVKDQLVSTGERLDGVKITVLSGVTVVAEVTTDANGEAILTLPGNTQYTYKAERKGYQPADGMMDVESVAWDETVLLEVDDSHNVKKDPASTTVNLIGAKKAPNGLPYAFTFEPIPGYRWKEDKMPAPGDISVLLLKKQGATGAENENKPLAGLDWDGNLNQYVLPADSFKDTDVKRDIQIGISAEKLEELVEPVPAGTIKVTTHAEEGGTFSYEKVESNSYVPDTTNDLMDLVETLGEGVTVSAKYTYTPTWADVSRMTETEKAALSKEDLTDGTYQGLYEDRVIDKLIVNGVEVALTMEQRIYGVKNYQLVGITENQTVTVTFGNAWIDPKEPGEEDDVIVDPTKPDVPVNPDDPPIDPVEGTKATVSVIVSEYGTAAVTAYEEESETPPAEQLITGYNRAEYHVLKDKDLKIKVTAATNVDIPGDDVNKADYIIDRILVNDTVVYVCDTASMPEGITWTDTAVGPNSYGLASGTLTLKAGSEFVAESTAATADAAAKDAATTTVTILFKPAAGEDGEPTDPIFTLLTLKKTAGEGTVSPSNEGMKVTGHDASFLFAPATGYQFDPTTVTVTDLPGGTTPNETVSKTAGTADAEGRTEVTLSNLNGGSLLVTYAFGEKKYKVRFTIYYGKLSDDEINGAVKGDIIPQSGATMLFTRPGEETEEVEVPKSKSGATQIFDYDLPAGTWTIELLKSGYVDYVVKGFVIMPNGTAGYKDHYDTCVKEISDNGQTVNVICFGMTESEKETANVLARPMNPKIGDANRDRDLIALDDVYQVTKGFWYSNNTGALKEYADVDENNTLDSADMTYVTGNLGNYRDDEFTYEKFMEGTLLSDYKDENAPTE